MAAITVGLGIGTSAGRGNGRLSESGSSGSSMHVDNSRTVERELMALVAFMIVDCGCVACVSQVADDFEGGLMGILGLDALAGVRSITVIAILVHGIGGAFGVVGVGVGGVDGIDGIVDDGSVTLDHGVAVDQGSAVDIGGVDSVVGVVGVGGALVVLEYLDEVNMPICTIDTVREFLVHRGKVVQGGGQLGLSLFAGFRLTICHKLRREASGRPDVVSGTESGHLACVMIPTDGLASKRVSTVDPEVVLTRLCTLGPE